MQKRTVIAMIATLITSLILSNTTFAAKVMDKDKAVKTLFKDLKVKEEKKKISDDLKKKLEEKLKYKLNPELDKEKIFFVATKDDNVVSYGCLDTIKDEYGHIVYLVKLDTQTKVEQVLVLFYSDEKAAKVSFPEFLKQFMKKSSGDALEVGKDIDAATGATVSSRAITNGIRKVILMTQEIYNIKPPETESDKADAETKSEGEEGK